MFRKQLVSFLHGGLLQNIREVEIMLKLDGKSRFGVTSRPTYNEYCSWVTCLCDTMMQDLNPNWRNEYHATELDKVLATFVELSNQRHRADVTDNPLKLCLKMPAPGRMVSQFNESPISPSSGTTLLTPGPSPLESVAWSFSGSSMSGDNIATWTPVSSPLPPPVELPVDPPPDPTQFLRGYSEASPPSAPLQSYEDNLMRCGLCNEPFKGSPQNQRRNLKRHWETRHNHNRNHFCPEPDCHEAFPRSDYLKKHRIDSHHLGDQSVKKTLDTSRKKSTKTHQTQQKSRTKSINKGRLHQ